MKKKYRGVWCAVAVLLLIVFVMNRQYIGKVCAEGWMEMAKRHTRQNQQVSFRYFPIDSLYIQNGYRYFLFAKSSAEEWHSTFSMADRDSLLLLTCAPSSVSPEETGMDVLFLPESGFDFLLEKDRSAALFRIATVREEEKGYRYQLERLSTVRQ